MKLYTRQAIEEIEKKYGFKVTKSLGQNFICDKGILDDIIEGTDIGGNDLIIEIGPGLGVLTAEAAKKAGRVAAVEIDSRLIPVLSVTLAEFDNIHIVNADILKTDVAQLIREEKERFPFIEHVKIIGNLPYYITTPIIMKLLKDKVPAESITVMMQKEVADRIRCGKGSRTYGVLSLSVQYYCSVSHIADVPKEVFFPRPKVDSEVIRLGMRKEKPVSVRNEDTFFACIKAGFSSRRKTLSNCLSGFEGASKEEAAKILESCGIDPKRRAETLGMDEFARLADAFEMRK